MTRISIILQIVSLINVKYLYTNDNARKLVVKANFTPDTLSVLLTSNLYAGDDKNPATGTKIGTVTIKVPRFLLSGSQELSMNMTGASTTPFEGSALASNAEGCDGEGIYAEIIEIIEGRKWIDNVTEIMVDNAKDLTVGDAVEVYAVADNAIKKLGGKACIFNRTLINAKIIADKYGFKYAPLAQDSVYDLEMYSDIIIQTTSVGNGYFGPSNESNDPLYFYNFKGNENVYDIIYSPEITPMMSRAIASGCHVSNGYSMLRHQGYKQFKLFTGEEYGDDTN